MGTPYTVKPDDTLSQIAQRHGYPNWEYIYYHDDNKAFRDKRKNPNKIYKGDILILPDKEADPGTATTPGKTGDKGGDDFKPKGRPRKGTASRRTTAGKDPAKSTKSGTSTSGRTTLAARYELREIVVCHGIQANNHNLPDDFKIPRSLEPHFPDNKEHKWERIDDSAATFVSHAQRVRFKIRQVTKKDEYKSALMTEGLHVVYVGHARYGRGPCFGPSDDKGDDWEQGTDPDARGLFRMGYQVIGIPFSEIEEHGYKFYPVEAASRLRSEWRHPDIPRNLKKVALPDNLQTKVLPQGHPLTGEYWGYGGSRGKSLLLWAGWKDTISKPMELGATDIKCRCACFLGCSTQKHWWKAVRKWKNWRREGEQYAYFTTAPCSANVARSWLRAVFEYPKRNDGDPWDASLEWAKRRASKLLRLDGGTCRIY